MIGIAFFARIIIVQDFVFKQSVCQFTDGLRFRIKVSARHCHPGGYNAWPGRLCGGRAGANSFRLRNLFLPDSERSLLVPRKVEPLGRKSEVDALRVEPFHDLHVDPIGVLQIFPVCGWMIPVNDDDIE